MNHALPHHRMLRKVIRIIEEACAITRVVVTDEIKRKAQKEGCIFFMGVEGSDNISRFTHIKTAATRIPPVERALKTDILTPWRYTTT